MATDEYVLHPGEDAPPSHNPPPRPTFTAVAVADRRIDALLQALRQAHVNGGALLAAFDVRTTQPDGKWYLWWDRAHGAQFDLSPFFESETLAITLPELRMAESRTRGVAWAWTGSFTLDGELTRALVQGGAYDRFQGPAQGAKRLALDFCDALFEYRYLDVLMVFRTYAAWSPWFHNVAWDTTWIVLDDRRNRLWLLCLTDTD